MSHLRVGRRGVLAVAAGLLATAGTAVVVTGSSTAAGPPQPPQDRVAVTTAPVPDLTPVPGLVPVPAEPQPAAADLGPVLTSSPPVRLDIPAIDLSTTAFVPLSVGADGVLPAPTDFATAGWYTGGPTPGELGPAVVAAHVDGPDGPALFYRLGLLVPGDEVTVTREDGTLATFVIDAVNSYAKAEFPTSLVYGATDRAEIRLITCGGAFDRSTGHYVDNVIAFGHLVDNA